MSALIIKREAKQESSPAQAPRKEETGTSKQTSRLTGLGKGLRSLSRVVCIPLAYAPRGRAAALSAVVFAGVAGFWLALLQKGAMDEERYRLLLTMSVVDKDGHPLPGVRVRLNEHRLGTSDSFGEWQRFVVVKPGQSLKLSATRSVGERDERLVKNLVAPLSDVFDVGAASGPPTLATRFEMGGTSASATTRELVVADGSAGRPEKPAAPAAVDSVQKEPDPQPVARVAKATKPTGIRKNAIAFSMLRAGQPGGRARNVLRTSLIPELERRARRAGLNVRADAPWQVAVGHVAPMQRSEKGLIRVVSRGGHEGSRRRSLDFLTNYTGSARRTAQTVLAKLKESAARAYPVVRRKKDWVLKVAGADFWTLDKGAQLRGSSGRRYELKKIRKSASEGVALWRVEGLKKGESPCAAQQSHCTLNVATPSRPRLASTEAKIFGLSPGLANVYLSGRKARFAGESTWRLPFVPGKRGYLTVVRDGRVIFRRLIDPTTALAFSAPSGARLVRRQPR